MERRKLGQETQKFRQWKEEMEKKEFSNSYKKEKEEQKRALEKVRADLERDRQAFHHWHCLDDFHKITALRVVPLLRGKLAFPLCSA